MPASSRARLSCVVALQRRRFVCVASRALCQAPALLLFPKRTGVPRHCGAASGTQAHSWRPAARAPWIRTPVAGRAAAARLARRGARWTLSLSCLLRRAIANVVSPPRRTRGRVRERLWSRDRLTGHGVRRRANRGIWQWVCNRTCPAWTIPRWRGVQTRVAARLAREGAGAV